MLDERGYTTVYVSGLHAGGKRQNHSKTENQRKILGIQIPGATPEYKTEIHHDTFGTHRISLWCGCFLSWSCVHQDWQYDKNVMTLSSDNNGTKVFQVTKSGTHTLTYVLKDNRNNEARVDYTFIVNEQSPMEISVTPKYSNKFMRAPLDLSLRSSVKLAHSADSIDNVTFKLNGKPVDGGKNYWSQTFENIMEGSYKLEMDVVSTQGQRGVVVVDFDVIPNTPPTCNLTYTETQLSWAFTAKCSDPDGKISSYVWKVNDQVRGVFGSTATLSKAQNKGKLVVSITAYDDSGDSATSFITLNN